MLTHTCPGCAAKTRRIAELERLLDGAVYSTKREAARLVRAMGITGQQAEVLTLLYRSGHDFVNGHAIMDGMPVRLGERTENNRDAVARVQITRLRKALGMDAIETAWGVGYRLSAETRKRVAEILEAK